MTHTHTYAAPLPSSMFAEQTQLPESERRTEDFRVGEVREMVVEGVRSPADEDGGGGGCHISGSQCSSSIVTEN